jgi:hypothetical protein
MSLELSRLSDDLANTAREYLARWTELEPAAREALGDAIAVRVGRVTAPAPPMPIPPPAFLSAVLAERRRRELAKLTTPRSPFGAAPTPAPFPVYGAPPGTPSYGGTPGTPSYGAPPGGHPQYGAPGPTYGGPPAGASSYQPPRPLRTYTGVPEPDLPPGDTTSSSRDPAEGGQSPSNHP